MTNEQIIANLKAHAAKEPFVLTPSGAAIQLPKGPLGIGLLCVDGTMVQVGLTYDLVPETGFKCEHISLDWPGGGPIPEAIQEKVKVLVFGPDAPKAKKHQPGRVVQWCVFRREFPGQKGFAA